MVEDYFPRNWKGNTVGLSCLTCRYLTNAYEWPNIKRDIFCSFHGMSLEICLDVDGNFKDEWFCDDFSDTGFSNREAVNFMIIKQNAFKKNIFYRAAGERFLVEKSFEEVVKQYGMGKTNKETMKRGLIGAFHRFYQEFGLEWEKKLVGDFFDNRFNEVDFDSELMKELFAEMQSEGWIELVGRDDLFLIIKFDKLVTDK